MFKRKSRKISQIPQNNGPRAKSSSRGAAREGLYYSDVNKGYFEEKSF
jgi:hypothetical protein